VLAFTVAILYYLIMLALRPTDSIHLVMFDLTFSSVQITFPTMLELEPGSSFHQIKDLKQLIATSTIKYFVSLSLAEIKLVLDSSYHLKDSS
jgi:hypothetical protein